MLCGSACIRVCWLFLESHKESVRKQKGLAKAGACNTDDDVLNKLEMLQLQEMRDREMHV